MVWQRSGRAPRKQGRHTEMGTGRRMAQGLWHDPEHTLLRATTLWSSQCAKRCSLFWATLSQVVYRLEPSLLHSFPLHEQIYLKKVFSVIVFQFPHFQLRGLPSGPCPQHLTGAVLAKVGNYFLLVPHPSHLLPSAVSSPSSGCTASQGLCFDLTGRFFSLEHSALPPCYVK